MLKLISTWNQWMNKFYYTSFIYYSKNHPRPNYTSVTWHPIYSWTSNLALLQREAVLYTARWSFTSALSRIHRRSRQWRWPMWSHVAPLAFLSSKHVYTVASLFPVSYFPSLTLLFSSLLCVRSSIRVPLFRLTPSFQSRLVPRLLLLLVLLLLSLTSRYSLFLSFSHYLCK